jgi:hypothetical protein
MRKPRPPQYVLLPLRELLPAIFIGQKESDHETMKSDKCIILRLEIGPDLAKLLSQLRVYFPHELVASLLIKVSEF